MMLGCESGEPKYEQQPMVRWSPSANVETGTTMVMDLDGYQATYGQLKDIAVEPRVRPWRAEPSLATSVTRQNIMSKRAENLLLHDQRRQSHRPDDLYRDGDE